ncbi:MAG: hydrogenase [Deltaproteobacteria bacterium]|nr:hydrogenase [Deltaproteobacteria bacterium]
MKHTPTGLHPLSLGGSVPLASLEPVAFSQFSSTLEDMVEAGGRLLSLFARPGADSENLLYALLARRTGTDTEASDHSRTTLNGGEHAFALGILCTQVTDGYPALTPALPAAHLFERDIFERHGITPEGHPWLRPVRQWAEQEVPWPMHALEGDEVHEVRVGPVHAGVIEPGHFRFQCHGERVFRLEIALGYQHRGLLADMVGAPHKRTIHRMETVAGDTCVGHSWAYAQTIEALSDVTPSPRAEAIRACGLELERLANHIGDLGAMAGDVGFLPTASYCGGLRGDVLNLSAAICGSRLGHGVIRVGGVGFDIEDELASTMREKLAAIRTAAARANTLLWASPSAMGRFEGTGTVPTDVARTFGLVGMAGRASGVDVDARRDFPTAAYRMHPVRPWLKQHGDVYARGRMRWREIEASFDFLEQVLERLPEGELRIAEAEVAADSLAVGIVEGWRGEVVHLAVTDAHGQLASYEIVDPSFHNWIGMEMALRGMEISDFPLCNKSFNLSYAGHDL